MKLGIIGLGRMGANIARRLMRAGHQTVVFDLSADAIATLEKEGAEGAPSLAALAEKLTLPRIAWVMLPAGHITEDTIAKIAEIFTKDDIVIDGGNTYFKDDIRRASELRKRGLHYVDVGTSGGV